jgi:hypothetical protein
VVEKEESDQDEENEDQVADLDFEASGKGLAFDMGRR